MTKGKMLDRWGSIGISLIGLTVGCGSAIDAPIAGPAQLGDEYEDTQIKKELERYYGVATAESLNASFDSSILGLVTEGGDSSGGGGAVVCRLNSVGQIVRAETADLFEGRVRFGLQIPIRTESFLEQAGRAIDRLAADPGLHAEVRRHFAEIRVRMNFLPEAVGMGPWLDFGSDYAVLSPDGCGLELAAFYESGGQVSLSRSVFGAMSETDKAALVIHEELYLAARRSHHISHSATVRKVVARLFAESNDGAIVADTRALVLPVGYQLVAGDGQVKKNARLQLTVPSPEIQVADFKFWCLSPDYREVQPSWNRLVAGITANSRGTGRFCNSEYQCGYTVDWQAEAGGIFALDLDLSQCIGVGVSLTNSLCHQGISTDMKARLEIDGANYLATDLGPGTCEAGTQILFY